jgi:hypothetical protein
LVSPTTVMNVMMKEKTSTHMPITIPGRPVSIPSLY